MEPNQQPAMMLTFVVRRREPVLIGPATPTPRETKPLSDIDSQESLRFHVPGIFIYRGGLGLGDPVDIIRRALSEALVHYYPLAGRLKEVAEGPKLAVDCTGEGVLFVEADADVRLADLEAAGLRAPFPCMHQLLFDVEGSSGLLNCPLVLIQVTQLLCGGFILAHRFNHTMSDAAGIVQFMEAVAELARGLPAPTVAPAWSRELLDARSPPRPAFPHREYDVVPLPPAPADELLLRSFWFRPAGIVALKKGLPPHLLDTATSFEVLAAFLWRARTATLALPPNEEMRLVTVVNFRRIGALALPPGYYGNACVNPTVVMTAETLRGSSLGDVVELVQKAKAAVTAEYVRSVADLLVLRGRPRFTRANLFVLTDVRRIGFDRVDFGWGEPVYGGPAIAQFWVSLLVSVKNSDGEDRVALPVVLPRPAMERFAAEIKSLLEA